MSEQIEQLLAEMTVSEKVGLCHAATKFTSGGVDRLGVPRLSMSDGPHGVRFEICADSWDPVDTDEDYVTYQPTGTALAATWSRECARRFGEVLGAEARDRGKDVILGPGINIIRTPLCGRNFEYYGEDPCHISEMVTPVIQGIQSQDTAACVKHYALNNQELNRHGVDARIDERTLREIYLPGFEAAVRTGDAWTVMGAYNLVRGQHCCHHDYLLNHILKDEWGFDGLVVSDWGGTHDTYEAARHGLDIEMGTPPFPNGDYLGAAFENAVENGEIEEAVLDDKARRILYVMERVGLFSDKRKSGARNTAHHQQTAQDIAEEATVLLKNDANVLPFNAAEIKHLLVVGDNAVRQHHLGGNSSAVKALYEVTPLEGIKQYVAPDTTVEFIQGYPDRQTGEPIPPEMLDIADTSAGTRGWLAQFYNNRSFEGEPVATRTVATPELDWEKELPEGVDPEEFSCRFEALLMAGEDEQWTFHLESSYHASLFVNDEPLIPRRDPGNPEHGKGDITLVKGQQYRLTVNVVPHPQASPAPVRCGVDRNQGVNDEETGQMLYQKAEQADAVLFFGGLNHLYDLESCDRPDMKLHDGQDDIIPKLAAANPRTAVVLVAGAPVEMPWIEEVPAVVQMWYAGMEAGHAIARMLFGEVNPSGKLPFSFPRKLEDSPAHYLGDYDAEVCHYREGVFVGYRWFDTYDIDPLFPFGHGLSYTEFEYSDLHCRALDRDDDVAAEISVKVRNSGECAGSEVVQLYVSDQACSVPRPKRELKGFGKVYLEAGEEKQINFEVTRQMLSFFHPVKRRWTFEAGAFTIEVGSSSRDIRLAEKLTIS